MKRVVLAAVALLTAGGVSAQSLEMELEMHQVRRVDRPVTTLEQVVCLANSSHLAVRSSNLRRIQFHVKNHEAAKVFQGWGDNKKYRRIRGVRYAFVKVQFPSENRRDNTGWVASVFIKPKSQCPGLQQETQETAKGTTEETAKEELHHEEPVREDAQTVVPPLPQRRPEVPAPSQKPEQRLEDKSDSDSIDIETLRRQRSQRRSSSGGLSDPQCCEFPLEKRPTDSYMSGMRRFGAGRSGGRRLHGACDLYRQINDPALSVSNGTVVRDLYYFYQGTYALEVKHQGGFIVRYGEITARAPRGVYGGRQVKSGQVLGYIGKVNSNCCKPMLHFELYTGTRKGSLSSGGNAYQRRSDLINPSKYLQKWESEKFSPMK